MNDRRRLDGRLRQRRCMTTDNMLLIGPPGTGKSMLTKRLPTILPPLTLEEGRVTISRAAGTMTFPSQFMLVAAMNPTPDGKMPGESRCSPRGIQNYLNRISGPLLDRIDIHVEVPPVKFREITAERTGETSAQIRERVVAARRHQQERFAGKRNVTCKRKDRHQGFKGLLRVGRSDAGTGGRRFSTALRVATHRRRKIPLLPIPQTRLPDSAALEPHLRPHRGSAAVGEPPLDHLLSDLRAGEHLGAGDREHCFHVLHRVFDPDARFLGDRLLHGQPIHWERSGASDWRSASQHHARGDFRHGSFHRPGLVRSAMACRRLFARVGPSRAE